MFLLLLFVVNADLFVNYNLGKYMNIYQINNTLSNTQLQCMNGDIYGITQIDTNFCYKSRRTILQNNIMIISNHTSYGYNVITNDTFDVITTPNKQISSYFTDTQYKYNNIVIANITHTNYLDEFVIMNNDIVIGNISHIVCYDVNDYYYYVTVNDTMISNLIVSQFITYFEQYHSFDYCNTSSDIAFTIGIIIGFCFAIACLRFVIMFIIVCFLEMHKCCMHITIYNNLCEFLNKCSINSCCVIQCDKKTPIPQDIDVSINGPSQNQSKLFVDTSDNDVRNIDPNSVVEV